jgi:hypothetical protein
MPDSQIQNIIFGEWMILILIMNKYIYELLYIEAVHITRNSCLYTFILMHMCIFEILIKSFTFFSKRKTKTTKSSFFSLIIVNNLYLDMRDKIK